MNNRKATSPDMRFVGFNDDWKTFTLDKNIEVLDGDRGHNYPNGDDLKEQGHTLFLSASNVTKNGFSIHTRQYITKEKSQSLGNGKLKLNDIILTSRGSIGHIALYDDEVKQKVPYARINSGMLILRTRDILCPRFISQYLTSPDGIRKINLISFGSAQPQLTKASVSKIELISPQKQSEQTKIGNFFQNLDKQLKLHQDKLAKLQQLKKAMLGKMFPKVGATVPEIRFAGFSDKWWHTSLGLAVNIIMGQSPNGINYTSNPEDHILVQGNADLRNGYVYPRSWTTQVTKRAFKGYLIFSVRAPVGDIGKTEYDVVLGRGVAALRANEFIFHQLKKLQLDNYWSKVSSGSTFDAISSTELAKTQIWMTNSKEQTKIGEYFQNLDLLITLQQQQINKLKNIKQACLDKMFV
jgi:type I restriction enzyme S subunit